MSRITPPNSTDYLSGLEDDKPYRASIASMEWETSEYKGKPQTQLVVYWALDDKPDQTIREYVGMRLGTQQNGQVSKLRQILNAIGNQQKTKEVAWFDDETLEWSYDGEKPYAKLEIGLPLILRGETIEKQTENGPKKRFVITGYRPSGIAERGVPAAEAARARNRPVVVVQDTKTLQPVAQIEDDDDIPF